MREAVGRDSDIFWYRVLLGVGVDRFLERVAWALKGLLSI